MFVDEKNANVIAALADISTGYWVFDGNWSVMNVNIILQQVFFF